MSPLTEAMIINGAVLFATLESGLGAHRKIGLFRILRTPLVVAAIIPLFLDRPVTHGNGLLTELVGVAHQVTVAAITDGLIFMAIAMVLIRTVGLAARATWLPHAPLAVQPGA